MSKLAEFIKLAEEATQEWGEDFVSDHEGCGCCTDRLEKHDHNFISATSPKIICQMVELIRLQNKALHTGATVDKVESFFAFEKFDNGE